jgi:hypothetical protein
MRKQGDIELVPRHGVKALGLPVEDVGFGRLLCSALNLRARGWGRRRDAFHPAKNSLTRATLPGKVILWISRAGASAVSCRYHRMAWT